MHARFITAGLGQEGQTSPSGLTKMKEDVGAGCQLDCKKKKKIRNGNTKASSVIEPRRSVDEALLGAQPLCVFWDSHINSGQPSRWLQLHCH